MESISNKELLKKQLAEIEENEAKACQEEVQQVLDKHGYEVTTSAHIVINGQTLGVSIRKKQK